MQSVDQLYEQGGEWRSKLIKASDPDASHGRNPRIQIARHPLNITEGNLKEQVPHELDFILELLCTAVHLVIEAIVSRTTCHGTCTTTFLRAVEIAPL